MKNWPAATLDPIRRSDDLHISPLRADGKTHGTPTWIWSVVVDNQLYVRAYHGVQSRWHRSALVQKAGRIRAAGMELDVAFEPVSDPALNERIDDAYRSKYTASPYLASMVSARARAATVRILPSTNESK